MVFIGFRVQGFRVTRFGVQDCCVFGLWFKILRPACWTQDSVVSGSELKVSGLGLPRFLACLPLSLYIDVYTYIYIYIYIYISISLSLSLVPLCLPLSLPLPLSLHEVYHNIINPVILHFHVRIRTIPVLSSQVLREIWERLL